MNQSNYIRGPGRPRGSTSKTNKEAQELFVKVLCNEVPYIEEAFKKVREQVPAKYLELMCKFAQYFVPKQVHVTGIEGTSSIPIASWATDDNKPIEITLKENDKEESNI